MEFDIPKQLHLYLIIFIEKVLIEAYGLLFFIEISSGTTAFMCRLGQWLPLFSATYQKTYTINM